MHTGPTSMLHDKNKQCQLMGRRCGWSQGKIVFVAPTKPLLTQQVEACYWKMGMSRVSSHTLLIYCIIVALCLLIMLNAARLRLPKPDRCHPCLITFGSKHRRPV